MAYKDPAKKKEYRDDKSQNAYDSITLGCIIDLKKWDLWCDRIKKSSKKYPYSNDFTNDVMFNMMTRGCFYCGDIATTIDRRDSTIDHTPDNCVGCCSPCNYSKGGADPSTFIRKAYYNARGEYFDDVFDVWFVNQKKPNVTKYKGRAEKKGVPFELTKEKFEKMNLDDCEYCQRSPTTWFGIDRIVPEKGYVDDNIVTCCWDCNNDKHEHDIVTTKARNERIAKRMDSGELIVENHPRVILHNGTQKSSNRVCVYGKIYASQIEASRALGRSETCIRDYFRRGTRSDDIFRITDEFYDEYKDSDLCITKNMFVAFDHFYTNE